MTFVTRPPTTPRDPGCWRRRVALASALCALLVAPAMAAEEIAASKTFRVQPGDLLRVDVSDANVVVRTGGGSSLQVEMVLSGDLDRARRAYDELGFTFVEDGEGVSIASRRPQRSSLRWGWGNYSITARVELPSRFDLDVRTGDGNVSVQEITGDVSITTGDGNIDLAAVEGGRIVLRTGDGNIELGVLDAAEVSISTGDGNVRLAGLVADEATVRTGDGNIDIRGIRGAVDAMTGDGNLSLFFEDFAGASLRTGDGDVDIAARSTLAADISLRGEEVALRGDLGSFAGERRERRVEGKLNGGGALLRAATGDGDVVLRLDD
ncbi:MAG: hypothetical protein DWQ36_07455 [Acidobacteria bacterium]|nr:MAG: hypothetical protein DWQ30_11860 [Acidobacteriota bacterium]REK09153.1 MAG: hypothetical protein DWQ36_07455 [Acidobacteriota bacterium]